MRPGCECRGLTVGYGEVLALQDVSLVVQSGEMMALLGPSGAGKSTLLSVLAGFVPARWGEVLIGGRVVSRPGRTLPPERRSVGFVFQSYALWPHLSALDTVAYPLRRAGLPPEEARARAGQLLERVGVGDLAERRPGELSGGQQQRVGLARALAREADLYLFDEPTAHLDAALRREVEAEIVERRRESGAAAVLATHDAAEALAVSDRVALLREGRLVQVGAPRHVYEEPVDLWAARLTGPASLLLVEVLGRSAAHLTLGLGEATVRVAGAGASGGGGARALVRPEWARLGGDLPGRVVHAWFRGPSTDYLLETPSGPLEVRMPGPPVAGPGARVSWSLDRVWLLER